MKKIVHVAAGIIRRADGQFLLGQRAEGTFYSCYWEFPGGKVEAGETPRDALVRELAEELGIVVEEAHPWLVREHVYEHAHVSLHFFEVSRWHGTPHSHVHSALQWQMADALNVSPMLPANGPIIKGLRLPREMGVTHANVIGIDAQLAALEVALARGLRLVQLREAALPDAQRDHFAREAWARCRNANAILLINGDIALAEKIGASGVHLPGHVLAATKTRPDFEWVGASCHQRAELEHAAALELDYAVLGSVNPTTSHPGQTPLGWAGFSALVDHLPIPVIAIGGLCADDLAQAYAAGAHGIAAIRAVWAG